jgi:diguanylate cyclase (GGDEF)-like protein
MISTAEILNAKVLIVDDQEDGACLLKTILAGAGHTDVTYTTNPSEVCALHRLNHYKVILLDLQMPGMNGFEVMQHLNAIEADDYVPILAITAESAYKVPALKAGAKDFISKPFDMEEVLTRVRNMLEIRLLHEMARCAVTTNEMLADQDPLTGLGNRRLLTKRISAALANARRNKNAMAVVYLDLDGFKQINDTLGHSTGDELLKTVARRLESVVREEDTVARVGGDEFMIALWQVSNAIDVVKVAAKLIEIVSQPYVVGNDQFTVTTSAGVSIFPAHGDCADELMKSADAALYEAKRAGKNAYRVAEHAAV